MNSSEYYLLHMLQNYIHIKIFNRKTLYGDLQLSIVQTFMRFMILPRIVYLLSLKLTYDQYLI